MWVSTQDIRRELDDSSCEMFLTALINQPSRRECPDCRVLHERKLTACPNCGRGIDADLKPVVAKRTDPRVLVFPR